MSTAVRADDEAFRLAELAALTILDTAPEPEFDDVARLAARLLDAPVALISLVGRERMWFKAAVNFDVREAPRAGSFCARTIEQSEPLVVADARADLRFAASALVTGEPFIRFYAGAPLVLSSGARVGTLCVIDQRARSVPAEDIEHLARLARQVVALLEQRRLAHSLRAEIAEREATATELRASEARFRMLLDRAPLPASLARDGSFVYVNDRFRAILGIASDTQLLGTPVRERIAPRAREEFVERATRRRQGLPTETVYETVALRPDGSEIAIVVHIEPMLLAEGPTILSFCVDVTAAKRLSAMLELLAKQGWDHDAQGFFAALAEHIGNDSGRDLVYVGRLSDAADSVDIIACFQQGRLLPNSSYALAGTPCELVVGNELCHHATGVQMRFPDDPSLAALRAESYLGVPLFDSRDRPLGLIAVVDSRPMPDREPLATLVQLAATRAAAELERQAVEASLARLGAYNRSLIDGSADAVLVFGHDSRISDLNGGAEEITGRGRAALLGRDFHGLFSARRQAAKACRAVLDGKPLRNLELLLRTRPGDARPVAVSAAPLRDAAGAIVGAVASLHDISERKKLERSLLAVTSREQRRLGHELHDGLGQQLTGLSLLLRAAGAKVRRGDVSVAAELDDAAALAASTIETCRNITRGLSPLTATQGSLAHGLTELARAMNSLGGPAFRCHLPEAPLPVLEPGVADHLYRIAQEACTNTLRHGDASQVHLFVQASAERLTVIVEDDGVGLRPDAVDQPGIGIKSMIYRANVIGADIDIGRAGERGTRIRCDVHLRTDS